MQLKIFVGEVGNGLQSLPTSPLAFLAFGSPSACSPSTSSATETAVLYFFIVLHFSLAGQKI